MARLRGKRPGELPAHPERPVRGQARSGSVLHGHSRRLCRLGCADGDDSAGSFLTALTNDTLPAFSFVTPNLCNDTHDCPVATGDAWLQSWFAKILASPSYLSGRTVVFLTWDEDDGSASNRVPMIVISPSTPAGTVSRTAFDHYALLKTTEQVLRIPTLLGHAGDAGTSSMVSAFNLG